MSRCILTSIYDEIRVSGKNEIRRQAGVIFCLVRLFSDISQPFRMQYIALVLRVQKPCTRSTRAMYLQYKAHVLLPGAPDGLDKAPGSDGL